jgi:hypothetical protein
MKPNIKEMKVIAPSFKFFSLALIILFIFSSCSNKEKKLQALNYLNNPKNGDVYFVDYGKSNFSSIKIKTITNDSILFIHNEFITSPAYFVDTSVSHMKNVVIEEINNSRFYKDSIVKYSKEEVLQKFDKNIIYKVKRK